MVGSDDGAPDGVWVGAEVGSGVGRAVGSFVGSILGCIDKEGSELGTSEMEGIWLTVGAAEGDGDGCSEGASEIEGAALGAQLLSFLLLHFSLSSLESRSTVCKYRLCIFLISTSSSP